MPYALFCQEAKISKVYPDKNDVWQHAVESGLVIDADSNEEAATPKQVLTNDYEIRECAPDPDEPDSGKQDIFRAA